jgi:hypothetical protein
VTDYAEAAASLQARADDDEKAARELLRIAQDVQLQLEEPALLGKHIPGWYSWPAVEAMAWRAIRDAVNLREVLDHYQSAVDAWAAVQSGAWPATAPGRVRTEHEVDALDPVIEILAAGRPSDSGPPTP